MVSDNTKWYQMVPDVRIKLRVKKVSLKVVAFRCLQKACSENCVLNLVDMKAI